MSVLAGLRRVWLNVHLVIGGILFIPFAILGVTGCMLLWEDAIEHQLYPQRYHVSAGAPAPLQADLDAARAAFGDDFTVTALRLPESAGDPLIALARQKGRPAAGQRPPMRNAWIDPATGRVLDTGSARDAVFGPAHALHGQLMLPENGRFWVGWLGLGMSISALTGIWLWWPRGALLAGFGWRRAPRTTTNLHHLMGFWLAIPLFVLAATGAYISFPQTSRALTSLFVETRAPQQRGPDGGGGPGGGPLRDTHMTIDAAVAAARAALPGGARIASVTLPTHARDGGRGPNWRVQAQLAGVEAMSNVSVDDSSGAARLDGGTPSPGENVARLLRRVHSGDAMSVIWRVIMTLAGLAPALLGVTGVTIWVRKQGARKTARAGAAAA